MTFFVVLRRELSALIALPQTYAIAAAYLLISGIFFVNILTSTNVPDLGQYYSNVASTLIVLCPIVAMRSFAEERKSGALDMTLSWPISRTGLVLGKYAANNLFIWLLVSVSWLYVRLIAQIADISTARAGGGFIGMLLLSAAFNALALMIASRASSPTGAAFLGFGFLLFLWILEFAPTFIRQSLRQLGPAVHFEPFPRGVLFAEDTAYFVIIVTAGLALSVQALGRNNPGQAVGSMLRRSAVLVAALVVLAGGLSISRDFEGQIDLTSQKKNTVTDATRDVLSRLKEPVTLIGYVQPISAQAAQLRSVVKQYNAAGADMELEIVDPDVQPAQARQEGIQDYNEYILKVGKRKEVLESIQQVPLTSAINRLSRNQTPLACFTTGHGERSITDDQGVGAQRLAGELRTISYQTEEISLFVAGGEEKLRECDVVVLLGPVEPFMPAEFDLLSGYLERNGRLVVMADGAGGPREQLNDLLEPWGVGFLPGIVRDLSALADDAASIVSADYPSLSPVTEKVNRKNIPVILANALAVEQTLERGQGEEEDEGNITGLVRSSKRSWIQEEGSEEKASKGPYNIGVISDFGKVVDKGGRQQVARTRIGVLGSVDLASNRLLEFLGNREFTSALVQWVSREDDIISAARSGTGLYRIAITKNQRDGLIRKGIVLPTLALLVPVPVALFRLKRG